MIFAGLVASAFQCATHHRKIERIAVATDSGVLSVCRASPAIRRG